MDNQKLILDRLTTILGETDKGYAAKLRALVDGAGRIFIGGAGRSGLVSRFFAMRLVHSGYQVNMVGEIVTPAIKAGDLLVIISGSGGTETLMPLVKKAKSVGAKFCVVSMKSKSAMQEVADLNIQIGNDSSFPITNGMPMGAQFELSSLLFLESVIADIVNAKNLTEEGMRAIHANLE
ncbi:MAG: 6-phospho-3-hexuloisomerase [Methylophilaceae bacterium]